MGPLAVRWTADRTLRRSQGGRVVLGGSPLKLFRLSSGGSKVLDSALSGELQTPSPQQAALLDLLVDAGAIHPNPSPGDGPYVESDVTVVIPVRDDQDDLDALIPRIWSTSPGIRNVVVVDDGSTAPVTMEHVDHARPTGCTVTVHRRPTSGGPGVARNEGLELVDTALVAFIDADCEPRPGWLEPLLAHFADPEVAVNAPRVVAIDTAGAAAEPSDLTPFKRVLCRALFAYERTGSPLDLGDQPARVSPGTRVSYVPTAALVARTETVRSIGGFDPAMRVGEDVDLIWRLVAAGERVRFVPTAEVGHQIRPSLTAWLRQRFAYGTSAAPLATRHGGAVAPVAVSKWSLGVWALAAAGLPGPAAGVAAWTTWQLRRKLPDVESNQILRLGIGGHLGAGRQLAEGLVRVWWPVAVVGSTMSRRIRRVSGAALVTVVVTGRERTPQGVAFRLLDDVAYGAGVWWGCVRERSFRSLLPRSDQK